MATVYDLSAEELSVRLDAWGEPAFRARQVWRQLWRRGARYEDMADVPGALRERLAAELPIGVEVLTERTADRGATRKALFRLGGQHVVEAVLMGYPDRVTVCISSQAGCAMGCTFCATGQFGFERHLDAGEIMAQVAYAQAFLRQIGMPGTPGHLTNVVFMGMGEPLANYDRVREAIRRMIEVMGMSARSITVSTVGIVPGIRRLAEEPWPVSLAVSLHAADDELRSTLVPINRRYPLAELEEAAARYFEKKRRRLSIEWTMMEGVNDTTDQAVKLAGIARRLHAHVNLIALNPTPLTKLEASSERAIDSFARQLRRRGVNVTVRDTRGRTIDGACGQLRLLAGKPGLKPRV